jgi:hypothetical protein
MADQNTNPADVPRSSPSLKTQNNKCRPQPKKEAEETILSLVTNRFRSSASQLIIAVPVTNLPPSPFKKKLAQPIFFNKIWAEFGKKLGGKNINKMRVKKCEKTYGGSRNV